MASHPPIPVMELPDHVERLKANDNLKFSQEYEVSVRKRAPVDKLSKLKLSMNHRKITNHPEILIFNPGSNSNRIWPFTMAKFSF